MSKQDDGGPAFPTNSEAFHQGFSGMTLRDWLAGQAIAGILAGEAGYWSRAEEPPYRDNDDSRASWAYSIADALLAQRAKETK